MLRMTDSPYSLFSFNWSDMQRSKVDCLGQAPFGGASGQDCPMPPSSGVRSREADTSERVNRALPPFLGSNFITQTVGSSLGDVALARGLRRQHVGLPRAHRSRRSQLESLVTILEVKHRERAIAARSEE